MYYCYIVPFPRQRIRHVPRTILGAAQHDRGAVAPMVPMATVDPIGPPTTTNQLIRGSVDSVTLAIRAS